MPLYNIIAYTVSHTVFFNNITLPICIVVRNFILRLNNVNNTYGSRIYMIDVYILFYRISAMHSYVHSLHSNNK